VLVATVASMVIGFVWYGPSLAIQLLGAAYGLERTEVAEGRKKSMAKS